MVQHPGALVGSDGEKQSSKKKTASKKDEAQTKSKMEAIFGFRKEDLTSWHNLVVLLNRPTDPAALGIFRCLFGEFTCVMTISVLQISAQHHHVPSLQVC